MTQFSHDLTHDGLNIKTVMTETTATLSWTGYSEMRTPETVLNPFFKNLLPFLRGKSLVVDFLGFDFMSSATQGPILQFLKNLDKNKIPVRVIYNTKLEWQRVSYRCMKVLFRTMPQIQFECV